ncbi:hypothetical protein OA92_05420 [Marinomonas sp. SBI22]|jgi:uncharacterized protein (TIGR02466 family)|uniref:putative 2OG-Fe(II) oxygenase n=1 Tax=unclassified Marinomonas TaxID=196814 RepID=UPI0007AF1F04|nr:MULTISPECIES: putative 2OG-Fe(II) oxygenase [unclassified Marinomonas]KZM44142.1 hypothetical protein OA92_05420 [Marinomonas sp. SBI22]KZM45301.1 hypothetical protein OA91_06565 [Marinomonas sp. SBI8L]
MTSHNTLDLDDTFQLAEPAAIEAIKTWTTPLFIAQQPDHEFLKDELVDFIYQCKDQQKEKIDSLVAPIAKHKLFESPLNFLEADTPEVMELKRIFEELLAEVAFEVNKEAWPEEVEVEANIIESWYHVTQNGGYHDAHSHPNCSWCGIYYLDPGESTLGERNGVNRFYDPRVNAEHYSDAGTAYLSGQGVWDFEPKEGQIIFFPSYLKHAALTYFGQKDRIVIAFNAVIDIY